MMVAAASRAPDAFAFALSELELDEPFSAVLTYDGAFTQPWSRIEVGREIVDVAYLGADAVALSNEGEVYFLDEDARHEAIPGAGVLRSDADGSGATSALLVRDGALLVSGSNGRIYRRSGRDRWSTIAAGDALTLPSYRPPDFGRAVVAGPEVWVIGVHYNASKGAHDAAMATATDWDAWGTAFEVDRAETKAPRCSLFHLSGDTLRATDVDVPGVLLELFFDAPTDSLWALGYDGTVLQGGPGRPMAPLAPVGTSAGLHTMTRFGERHVIGADYGLFWFDGHIVKPLRPRIDPAVNRGVPVPLRVSGHGDTLLVFDRKHGVLTLQADRWNTIVPPDELLARR